MPYVASIGTYLPCWEHPTRRRPVPAKTRTPSTCRRRVDRPHLSHVDMAKVHDFFTGNELISYEDHGFAERFGGHKLVEADVTTIGGGFARET